MSRLFDPARSLLRRGFAEGITYQGSGGTAWYVGSRRQGLSAAAFFCGDDVRAGARERIRRGRVSDRIDDVAGAGGLPIVQLSERNSALTERAIAVPALVDLHVDLPADVEELRAQIRTSTTKEDLRRIRKAGFTYRTTTAPDAVREFHARHYAPNVAHRFPDDGVVRSLDGMLSDLERGGELVCADIDDQWVAGIYNTSRETVYALASLGIRDADEAIRNKRVVSALIVRSLERAVELGKVRATLGRSLPFLGKGPVWFKAKWGAVITTGPTARPLHMFMDLRHEPVRRMLAASPVIHTMNDVLVVSAWLEAGDQPLRALVRDAGRFPGITRWFVLGLPEILEAGAEALASADRIVPVPVVPRRNEPTWLSRVLAELP